MDSLNGSQSLPSGWTQHQSSSHPGLSYYYNKNNNENRWSRPHSEQSLLIVPEVNSSYSSKDTSTNFNTTSLPCSTEEIAWVLGCLIGQIFNQDPLFKNLNLSSVSSIPVNVQPFYRKCLNKNPKKRPDINMLREFLGQSSLDTENLPREVDGEGAGGRQQYQGGKPVNSVAAVDSESGTLDNVVQPCHEVAVGDFEEEDDAGVAASFGEHTCPLCYKVYSNRQHLRRHTKSTHSSALEELLPKKKFSCVKCSKSYNRAQSLKRHVLSHKLRDLNKESTALSPSLSLPSPPMNS